MKEKQGAVLSIDHFSKTYKGGKRAVCGLDLELHAGEICGFIGHNGAGKTTTLRAVAGILDFEEGDILILGRSVKADPLWCKRQLAYIPDNPDLYEYLTGIQYLNFIGDIFRLTGAERTERISEYGDRFGMTRQLGDLISSYSHGMKQKLALMSALLHRPRLLLLDEPFVGLDPEAAVALKDTMRELCGEGSAILFSTHVLDVAEKLCTRIAIIRQGKLAAAGTIGELVKDRTLEDVFLEVARHD